MFSVFFQACFFQAQRQKQTKVEFFFQKRILQPACNKDWKIFLWQRDKIDLNLQNFNEIQEDFQETFIIKSRGCLYYKTMRSTKNLKNPSGLQFYS